MKQTSHGLPTRIAHMGLAVAVVIQLLTSLVFVAPSPRRTGNIWFQVHEYAGLFAFISVMLFWVVMILRRRGTAPGLMLPWLSRQRLSALWTDILVHLRSLRSLRPPDYDEHSPLASAVHGLGLVLMTAMAGSGTIYYFINTGDPDAGGLVGIVMLVHKTLANVVWAYLIGHAGLALIHHFTQNLSLSEMWAVSKR